MPAKKATTRRSAAARDPGFSSAAVLRATGKPWREWLARLDHGGAKAKDHKGIVAWLTKRHPHIGGWWIQMITVGYERARGMRVKHQTPRGFEIGVTKTIAAPVGILYAAFVDPRLRKQWLSDRGVEIRTAKLEKSVRMDWVGGTQVTVEFQPKGWKTTISVQHVRLADAKDAAARKRFWTESLGALAHLLVGSPD